MKVERKVTSKIAIWLMGLAVALTVMNLPGFVTIAKAADSFKIDYLTYEVIDSKSVKVKQYSYASEEVVTIPKTVTNSGVTYNVVEIGDSAFSYRLITGVEIPDSVTTIGKAAFKGCNKLTSLEIPNSVTTMGDAVFSDCRELTSVVIPDSVTSMGQSVFYCCYALTSVTLPKNITSIGRDFFGYCRVLTDVNIPESVTTIGPSAFSVCENLKSVKLPSKLTKIEYSAFSSCKALESITIPASVTTIEKLAFSYCNLKQGIYFEGKVTEFGNQPFQGVYYIQKVVVPNEYYDYYKEIVESWDRVCSNVMNQNCEEGMHEFQAAINFHFCKYCSMSEKHDCTNQPYIVAEAGKHYQNCGKCGAKDAAVECTPGTAVKENIIPATCVENGFHTDAIYCTGCNQKLNSLAVVDPATGNHKWGTSWLKNAKNHFKECSVCGKLGNGAAHADNNKDGKCDTCSYSLHVHAGTLVPQVNATCTKTGVKAYYKCSCGKFYLDAACTKAIADLAAWKAGAGMIAKTAHSLAITTTKATTTVDGKKVTACTICKAVTKDTTIYAAKNIVLSTTSYAYDGKAKKPAVTVKDSKGNTIATTNYTVTYSSGRKTVGKYTVKVTFKGDYSGTKSLSFVINPKATTIKSVTPATKAFTVKWTKRTTQVDGYQLQYATDEKFSANVKNKNISQNDVVSKKISKLQAKKNYYVRVRTYKTVGTTKYYSAWSKSSVVKTK